MATAQDILNKYGLNSAPVRSADVLGKYGLLNDEEKKQQDWERTRAQAPVGPDPQLAGPAGIGEVIGQSLSNTGRTIAAGAEQAALRAIPAAVDQANQPLIGAFNPLDPTGPVRALGERAIGSFFSDEVEDLRNVADQRLEQALPGLVAGEEEMANLQRSRGNDFLGEAVGDIAGSATSALPLAAAAITGAMTRSPSAAATAARLTAPIPAMQAKAQAMLEAKRAGMSDAAAERYSNVVTGVEFATEALAPGPGSSVASTIAKRVLGEQASEQLATAGESLAQTAMAPTLAPQDTAEALERQRRTIAPALFFGGVTAPIGARAVTEAAKAPIQTGDPAFDAGAQLAAAATPESKIEAPVSEPAQIIPPAAVPKPRYRLQDGQLVPVSEQIPPVADVTQPVAPFADDADTLASDADLATLDQQLASEQQRTVNAEARNRVITELTTSRDKKTAANLERMIADGRINFYGDQTTLPEGANSATDKGYFDGQRIYLNESKLVQGEATSVALHEIKHYMDRLAEDGGQPVNRRSLRQFLGNEGNARVNTRIGELANTGNVIAREAIEDARAGATREDGSFDQAVFDDEISPYFLQRVAAARDSKRPLGRALAVVKDIISAAKTKIADFGIDLNLSENDILYLGKQLVGAAANTQGGQGRAQNGRAVASGSSAPPIGRAMLVGKKAANYKQYLDQGIVFAGALDKLPRAEIDDSRTSIRPEGKELLSGRGSTFLGAVFNHPELYENYPDLKRTRVRLLTPEELKPNPKLMGEADASANTIAINPSLLSDEKELRRLLVHEGQHIIQEKEGFIPGAATTEFQTPQDMAAFTKADRDLSGFLANVDRDTLSSIKSKVTFQGDPPVSAGKILSAALEQDPTMRSFELEEKALLKQYLDNVRAYTPLAKKRTEAFEKYRRTGGEVEARTAEARIPLTQGERRSTPFSETSERMVGGVKATDLVDNTDPNSGSRFAAQRAAQRQKVLSETPVGRASRSRPEQPKRVTAKLGSEGISQPLSRRAPVPTQARGVVPASRSEKFVAEKTRIPATESVMKKLKAAGDIALAAVAPSTYGKAADVQEILERTLGETTESKVRAAQALNALQQTIARVPKQKKAAVERTLAAAGSTDGAVRTAARESLKANYPAVFAQYDSVRNQIRQWGLDAVVSIRDSGKQLTKKDVAIVSKILKNLDTYLTRTYRIDQKGRIADQQKKDTLGAWEKEVKAGNVTSEGAKTFEEARQYLVDTLRIGDRKGMLKAEGNLKDFKPQTLEQLEALHAEWVSRENFNTLPADATAEQQETYINTMLLDLENVRGSMTDTQYQQALDDKALRLAKELVDTVNTGSSKLVQFFRGARQDNTIVSARSDVPEAIRKLWGEITEPTAALAITMMRQGEFLSRQKMLRELYDIGLGRYFVDQKDAKSDTFTEKLVGETFGPLEGMYATPSFKRDVESNIEPINSWQKVLDALVAGKADVATQAAAGMGIKFISRAGSANKKATVVYNLSSWVNNFLGGPATPIMQGMIPGKNLAKATKAAIGLIGPSFNQRLSPEAQRVLKANLQESGQVGEIQAAQRDIIENLLLERGFLGKLNNTRRNVGDKVVDAYAMTDVVWKLDAFFSTVDWLKAYYKAKGITRTDEQIDREAAERVKDRSITFSRAAPLVKFTEKLGVTSYAPYFYETYRVIAKSLIGAGQDILAGQREGGKAGKMKIALGVRSALGASMALGYNRAILPAYQAAGAATLGVMTMLGAMDAPDQEEEEKLAVIRKGMADFYAGKELSLYRITEDGKYIFIEPGRVNPNDPATTPAALLMSGDPETAMEAITGLFFGNQGIAAVLGVGQEVLTDSKAKKPSSAFNTPESYNEMVDILQNNLGLSPDTTAQATRIFEKYVPKVLRTTLRETTEDTGLTGGDKFLAAMGQPFAVFDPKKDLRMTGFRDYNDPIDKAKEDFKTVIQTTNPSDEVIKNAYLNSLKNEHQAYTRMREVVEAAKMTGMKPNEIGAVLKAEKVANNTQIGSLLNGDFRVTFVSPTILSNAFKQEMKAAEGDEDKIAALKTKYRRIDSIIRSTTTEFKDLIASEETN